MRDWIYQGNTLVSIDDVPEKSMGFIYLITQLSTGKKYIGRKLLDRAATKVVKGKKKKIRVESDWLTYWSSSPKIKQWIEENGYDDFSREILLFVESKSQLMYAEEAALYHVDALLRDDYLNDNIRSKVMRNWFQNAPTFYDKMNDLRGIIDK